MGAMSIFICIFALGIVCPKRGRYARKLICKRLIIKKK